MGAIVNIFKAIFGGIFGLFSKKKNGFYREAPPIENAPAEAASAANAVVAAPVNVEAATASGGTTAKTAKKGKASAKKGEATPAVAAAKKVAAADPLDLINAALAASKVAAEEAAVSAGGFADKYMLPLPTERRRPGVNMAMYKSMAKDLKRF